MHLTDLGTIHVEQLQASVDVRILLSNLEDVLLPWLTKGATGGKPALDLEVTDGRIDLHDVPADQQWKIDTISTTLRISPASLWPLELSIGGIVQTDAGPKKFKLSYLADGTATNGNALIRAW